MRTRPALSAVILAGGRATRMGGNDKGLIPFLGAPLVERICAVLAPQVSEMLINANRNLEQYQQLGHKVIKDYIDGYQGPLAGMQAALFEAEHSWLLTAPCDGPYISEFYADRMLDAATAENVHLAVAHDGERLQPVYALIHRNLADSLVRFLQSGQRKIDHWYGQHAYATVDFSADRRMFANINSPENLGELERSMRSDFD